MFIDSTKVKFLLNLLTFLSLSAIFYVYYFTEVVTKYANGYTNLVVSYEEINHKIKPPILTVCTTPHSKIAVLKKYNVTASTLSEPSEREEKILEKFNLTFVDFFREVTFSLSRDFNIYLTIWIYGNNGWDDYKIKLNEGIKNIVQVHKIKVPEEKKIFNDSYCEIGW